MDVFLDLNSRRQTIVMVTHKPENAALADRTIQIRDVALLDDRASAGNGMVSRQTATTTAVR